MPVSYVPMKALSYELDLETASPTQVLDLTPRLRELVAASGIRNGQLLVASRHTTCAISINENEPRLFGDVLRTLERLVPPGAGYDHDDIEARGMPEEPRNAHAHIAAMLLGCAQVVAIRDGELALGTWQSVLFFELDGPRRRTVGVQITGE